MSSSDHEQAAVEQDGAGRGEQVPAALSAKKLWRMVRAVHLGLVRGLGKHQPKLAALGVSLHHMLSSSKRRHHHLGAAAAADQGPALTTYLAAALSCRSMDPAAAVHPYPRRGARGGRGASSLSCRSMDPGAAVYQQYQYKPRDVEFSCKSTPLHRRRRRAQRHRDQGLLLQQQQQLDDLPEYGSAVAVKTLFELMDGDEDDDGDMESAIPWAASAPVGLPAPRQVRITDSPFPAREDDQEGSMGVVDRRADEFIVWFHDQLRMQQQQPPQQQQQRPAARDRATHWVR